ncbi:fibronectin type III domain-containing protein [Perkinsela sp. CCAP 1560/4]|nr:fibronectin type III domain-containing protein [Perkinsela sp. CCAP 1560/4]|eukprot:KNH07407.1 fibronectin type III domain-containing protein [Perkinsela sp. CCAP 1560/4]
MNSSLKKEAFKLEAATTQATNTCFDMCVDFRNPKVKPSFSEYVTRATDYVASITPMAPSVVGTGTSDLTVDEVKCVERCAVKYIQTQRILLQGIAKTPTPLRDAAADCVRM